MDKDSITYDSLTGQSLFDINFTLECSESHDAHNVLSTSCLTSVYFLFGTQVLLQCFQEKSSFFIQ